MNKSKFYSSIVVMIGTFILWDLVDYFILDLVFPRERLDRFTFALPMVMLIFIVLLDRESKQSESKSRGRGA